jgi:hypothetical protein
MGQYVRTLGLEPIANDQRDLFYTDRWPESYGQKSVASVRMLELRKKTGACASWVKTQT